MVKLSVGQTTIIQAGPALQVRGGVSAVERLIVGELGAQLPVHHVSTMEDGSTLRKMWVYARALLTLHRLCAAPTPQLFHIHFASWGSTLRKSIVANMAAGSGHAVVLHAHGGGFADFMQRMPAFVQRRIRRMLQRADQLIVLSTQWQRYYIDECGVPAERVSVLRNPVRIPEQLPTRTGRSMVRLVCLGRMSESKGTFDLLRALDLLPPAILQQLHVTFAGDGAVAQIRTNATKHGSQITVLDWVDEPTRNALLADADVFVLPSYQEGIPMSLLEAMAWALPSITTPVGGIPDVMSDGEQGVFVQPGDTAALAAAITTLVADRGLREAMGARARAQALKFDLRNYAQQLTAIYDRVAAARTIPSPRTTPR
jgi:glycosyltransferase involved in cell wall biosynthesis